MSDPLNAQISNLGWANTRYSDYAPVISADESILIFTSRRPGSTGGLVDAENKYFEDIYITYNTDGIWSPPENMGTTINTEHHDAGIGLAPDGQTLFIYRSNPYGGGDIYSSRLKGYDWEIPTIFDNDIKYLALCQMILGTIAIFTLDNPESGFILWTAGFGVMHIVYGTIMYFKYDRKKI